MNVTDEQLSAFLDAELPVVEMEFIREQLLEDETLADRLAELALVDELVAASARQIDQRPVPQGVNTMLQEQPASAQIIAFPLWKRIQRSVQQPVALAASVALVIGFGVAQLMNNGTNQNNWSAVAEILESSPSGVVQVASNGSEVKPRLTFKNHQGDYCRQFDLKNSKGQSENIACRQGTIWQLTASVVQHQSPSIGDYQTASGGSGLDEALEQMVAGDIFNAQIEADIINNRWSK